MIALALLALTAALPPVTELTATPVPLPGAPGRVGMDYLAVDDVARRVWVPAGNTGRVDLVDTRSLAVSGIGGFATATRGERTVGPSAVSLGEGFAYVGDRATSQVCAVARVAPALDGCVTLASPPDGVAYVATTKEVWVTTPGDNSLTILDVSTPGAPRVAAVIPVGGRPEGYAVDAAAGQFFTNLEDQDATLVYDVKARTPLARWAPGCGEAGPRGLALDARRGLLVVACTDKVVSLALRAGGAKKGELATGGGVDNIDYVSSRRAVYVASGKAAMLTIASLGDDGTLVARARARTAEGARVVVADAEGTAFVADSAGGRLLAVRLPPGFLQP
jgi:DNA-binding beta-propeller fold protein YncE